MEQIIKHKNQWIDLDSILSISDSELEEDTHDSYVVYYVNFKCAMYPGSSDNPLSIAFHRDITDSIPIVVEPYPGSQFAKLIAKGYESYFCEGNYSQNILLDQSKNNKPACEINHDKERDILLEQWIAWKKFKNQ
jgi:hypothetical protein